MEPEEPIDLEIASLLSAVNEKYGYDFRQYSRAHTKRRIMNHLPMSGIKDIC